MMSPQSGSWFSTGWAENPRAMMLPGLAGWTRADEEQDTPDGSTRINTSLQADNRYKQLNINTSFVEPFPYLCCIYCN